jgi:hypothetical protein
LLGSTTILELGAAALAFDRNGFVWILMRSRYGHGLVDEWRPKLVRRARGSVYVEATIAVASAHRQDHRRDGDDG